jgi:hypothetical protein
MRRKRQLAGDLHRGAVPDDPAVEHGDEAAVGEVVDLTANLGMGVGWKVVVGAPDQRGDGADVARASRPYFEPRLAERLG